MLSIIPLSYKTFNHYKIPYDDNDIILVKSYVLNKYILNFKKYLEPLYAEAIYLSGRTDIHINYGPAPAHAFDVNYSATPDMEKHYYSLYVTISDLNRSFDLGDFWNIFRRLDDSIEMQVYTNLRKIAEDQHDKETEDDQ